MSLILIGLGPGDPELMTRAAYDALTAGGPVYLRTARHGAAERLTSLQIVFTAFDSLYDQAEDFDALCQTIAETVLTEAENRDVIYAVPGNGDGRDRTVAALLRLARERGIGYTLLPGVGYEASLYTEGADSPVCTVLPASEIASVRSLAVPLFITELDSVFAASDVKLHLSRLMPDDGSVWFVSEGQAPRSLPLFELDRQPDLSHTAALLVPAQTALCRRAYTFEDLCDIMKILRGPDGCPWDKKQTHESLKPCVVEEAYEVVDAIDGGDTDRLCDELGDLLMQVAIHAQLAAERTDFDALDVTTGICQKMIRRHAHIFGEVQAETAEDVIVSWEKIKKGEKQLSSQTDVLKDIPRSLPALMRLQKILKKASLAGFTLPADAAGDPLLACVAALTAEKADAEQTGAQLCDLFILRFSRMEAIAAANGQSLEALSPTEWRNLWEKSSESTT